MRTDDFDYNLPPELIAAWPLARRDASRLFVVRRSGSGDRGAVEGGGGGAGEDEGFTHARFSDLPCWLRPGDCLVVNDSRVIPARLRGRRAGGGRAEALLLHPVGAGRWRALVRPGAKLREGGVILLGEPGGPDETGAAARNLTGGTGARLVIESVEPGGERILRIESMPGGAGDAGAPAHQAAGEAEREIIREIIQRFGEIPLPPYIIAARREAGEGDSPRRHGEHGEEIREIRRELKKENRKEHRKEYRNEHGEEIMEKGSSPCPPCLRGESSSEFSPDGETVELGSGPGPGFDSDAERYQTVYAREEGSVAAPTAGLHFTPELLETLARAGIEIRRVTLHVGPGTFAPVKTDDPLDHVMHEERFTVDPAEAEAIEAARRDPARRVIAVGTTAVRVLETLMVRDGAITPGDGATSLKILPGHAFRAIDGMITNFHLPRSTLLMLVSALAGRERILAAYASAIHARYRFFSYGDAMLIL